MKHRFTLWVDMDPSPSGPVTAVQIVETLSIVFDASNLKATLRYDEPETFLL